jgi:hypothetical protein
MAGEYRTCLKPSPSPLGTVRLLKSEDDGAFYHDDTEKLTPPDFRIVTGDGQHLLVEVKNVAPRALAADQRMRSADVAAQSRYAQATGARLMVAHYWAAMNLWTMVDEQVLSTVAPPFGPMSRIRRLGAAVGSYLATSRSAGPAHRNREEGVSELG